jgi:peptidoglycan/LPS O-acetylase OafA/YrhL
MLTVDPAPQSGPERAQGHLVFLDQCRGVAILLVFLCHCTINFTGGTNEWFLYPFRYAMQVVSGKLSLPDLAAFITLFPFRVGWVAVPIFFVVSGFCIHLSYCQARRPSLTAFYIRRVFRIYPAYLVALLVFATVFPGTSLPFTKLTHWAILISHLFQFHNFFETSVSAINGVYWTIAIEVQLYLLYPLFLRYARRCSFNRLLVVLGVIELSLHTISFVYFYATGRFAPIWLRASPFFYCFSWTLGAALADSYLNGKVLAITKISPIVWLVLWFGCSFVSSVAHEFGFTLFALAVTSIIARHLNPERVTAAKRTSFFGRIIEKTGVYSYSIYLIHYPIMVVLMGLYDGWFPEIKNQPFLSFGAATTTGLVIFPISILMYYSLEAPGIALGKRVIRAWSARTAQQIGVPVGPTA